MHRSAPEVTPPGDEPTTYTPTRRDYLILAVLWTVIFAVWSQFLIVTPLLSDIALTLDVSKGKLGWIVSGYALALSVCTLVWGPVSDRIGRRRILLIGTGSMAVVLAAHWFADSFTSLLIMRILAGSTAGMCAVGAVAYIGDHFPKSHRGWATGWVLNGFAVGQVVGIPLGAFLASLLDYRIPFVFSGLIMVTAFALVLFLLPQPDVDREPRKLSRIVLDFRSMFSTPLYRATIGIGVSVLASMGLFVPFFAVWMGANLGHSTQYTAWVFSLGGIATVLTAPRAGRLSDRIGRARIIFWGSFVAMGCMLAAPSAILWPPLVFAVFAVFMMGVASRAAGYRAFQMEVVDERLRGQFLSLCNSLEQLGFGLGSAAAGLIYASLGFTANCIAAAAVTCVILLLTRRYLWNVAKR
ncbi:MFS transporter [Oceanidesulfovibrio indonesiensis]|uniref:MFS transporter n=1 Tax=Oceanidesulfovibrio indonesiensis TaxID=54767 RepID=A0A7M3MEH7_9BACT|nr:MFS transporter [Oceanidesulfovibrio indonesiensis]TVM17300.1 MFS transporter [Oceanidesulfovibrio indonesiensis]